MTLTLIQRLEARARELGFLRIGVIPAAPLDHALYFDRWLTAGYHGEMRYMENHRALRVDPASLEPGTQTVIAVAMPYGPRTSDEIPTNGIARYALLDDYHEHIRARLRELAAFLHVETGRDVYGRPVVDSAPLLERNLAVQAGIGWQGKSAMVISRELGTYTILAELLIDMPMEAYSTVVPDSCGSCTKCIEACPTQAIVGPREIDARRCISYLTIEHRGPIPMALREGIGQHLFGCDVCQEVCPWNRRVEPPPASTGLFTRPEVLAVTPAMLVEMDQTTFSTTFRRSPIKRAKRRGMARNAAVVLGNLGDPTSAPLLARVLRQHDEPLVRGHAAWALGKLGEMTVLRDRLTRESDTYVLEEIRQAIDLEAEG